MRGSDETRFSAYVERPNGNRERKRGCTGNRSDLQLRRRADAHGENPEVRGGTKPGFSGCAATAAGSSARTRWIDSHQGRPYEPGKYIGQLRKRDGPFHRAGCAQPPCGSRAVRAGAVESVRCRVRTLLERLG